MMLMKYVRTSCRTGAEHIHLGNRVDLYTAVGYRWPCIRRDDARIISPMYDFSVMFHGEFSDEYIISDSC